MYRLINRYSKYLVYLALLFMLVEFPYLPQKSLFIKKEVFWLYILVFSTVFSYLTTLIVRKVAQKIRVEDLPGERKVHREPTPLLGGLAIFISFTATTYLNQYFSVELKGILLGASLVFLISLLDDIICVSSKVKLIVQLLACLIIIKFGIVLSFLPDVLWGKIGEIIITVIWVVGITNAFNFFDGVDGLATGLGIVTALFLSVIAIQTNQYFLMILSVALMGSCLGFIPHNFKLSKPADIFLGDAGSTFIGFTLASLAILGKWAEVDSLKDLITPVLIFGVLIFDMTYISISRILEGQVKSFKDWIDYVGRDHLHHRLIALGLSKRLTTLFICFLAATLGLSAIVLKHGEIVDALLMLLQVSMIFVILSFLMKKGAEGMELVSYKLRKPLSTLLGFTEVILEGQKDRMEKHERFLEVLNIHGEKLLQLIDNASEIFMNQKESAPLKISKFNLNGLIEEIVEDFKDNITERNHSVNLELDMEIEFILADKIRISRMIWNLIDNALKYTPDGGNIHIKSLKENDLIYVHVKDNGIGIAEERLKYLFTEDIELSRFDRRRPKKSGLGITSALRIAKSHGGDLKIKSEPGGGTEVIIILPQESLKERTTR
ncbi:MAG: ATP-binding protein [Fidelibacterota bacterium]